MRDQASEPEPPCMQELTSALTDGELAGAELQQALEQLRADAQERARWRDYHLIGEALRATVLLTSAEEDAAFVLRLRQRLLESGP